MHAKFGLNQPDFEKMVDEQQYTALAEKLKASLENGKIREGDYESAYDWLKKTAKMNGKTI